MEIATEGAAVGFVSQKRCNRRWVRLAEYRDRSWVRFAKMHLPLQEPSSRGLQADGGASTSRLQAAVGFVWQKRRDRRWVRLAEYRNRGWVRFAKMRLPL
jgi:hypothetical protein